MASEQNVSSEPDVSEREQSGATPRSQAQSRVTADPGLLRENQGAPSRSETSGVSSPHSDPGLLAESISPGGYTPTWLEAALLADAYNSLVEQYAALERERDAIGAALGEPCAECGHIDWRSDGYADDLVSGLKEQLEASQANERHLTNLLSWREKERNTAQNELAACRMGQGEALEQLEALRETAQEFVDAASVYGPERYDHAKRRLIAVLDSNPASES